MDCKAEPAELMEVDKKVSAFEYAILLANEINRMLREARCHERVSASGILDKVNTEEELKFFFFKLC